MNFAICFLMLFAADDSTPLSVVQQLFEAVAHKDIARASSLFTPDAMLYSAKEDGTAGGIAATAWIARMGNAKDQWLERIS